MHPIIALPVSTIALGERVLSSNPTEVAKAPWESLRLFNLLSRSGHTHRFPNRSGIAPRVIMLSLDKSVNHKMARHVYGGTPCWAWPSDCRRFGEMKPKKTSAQIFGQHSHEDERDAK